MERNYITHGNDGARLPLSGFLVGKAADYLRLRGALRDDDGYDKTAQRYLRGLRVDESVATRVRGLLIDELAAESVPAPACLDRPSSTMREFLEALAMTASSLWDLVAGECSQWPLPHRTLADVVVAVLRLVSLDLGIRWGAWSWLNHAHPEADTRWTRADVLPRTLDQLRGSRLSWGALEKAVGVTANARRAWKKGDSLPRSANIHAAAEALASTAAAPVHEIEFQLRLAVGVAALRSELVSLLGEPRVVDFVGAAFTTAKLTHEYLSLDGGVPHAYAVDLLLGGARTRFGAPLCQFLESRCLKDGVAADLAALGSDWTLRISHWAGSLATTERQFDAAFRHFPDLSEASGLDRAELTDLLSDALLRMQDYDRVPDADAMARLLPDPPPAIHALTLASEATRALSAGRPDVAVPLLRKAVQLGPEDAGPHFYLGAALGQLAQHTRDPEVIGEALQECHLAVALDPDFFNARNEIGITLSNVGRHEEAEQAFAAAAPSCESYQHHHFTRGQNLLVLSRWQEAKECFESALRLAPDGPAGQSHRDAMIRLHAVLRQLGAAGAARRLNERFRREYRHDLEPHWEEHLDPRLPIRAKPVD